MKKYVFSAVLLIAFLANIKAVMAVTGNCYVGTKKVGTLQVYNSELWADFVAVNEPSSVIFYDNNGYAKSREVSFKLGNSAYFPFTFRDLNQLPWQFGTIITSGSDNCGKVYATVVFRSIKDGKMHYCSVETPKYQSRKEISADLKGDYNFTYSDPNARQAVIYEQYDQNRIEFQIEASRSCADYGLYLNNQLVSKFSIAPIEEGKYCYLFMHGNFGSKPVTNGSVNLKIEPTAGIISNSLTQYSSKYQGNGLSLLVYDQNGTKACGGMINK